MILKCWLDYYGVQAGRTLKYISDGEYKDMLILGVTPQLDTYCGKYMVKIKLRSMFNIGNIDGRSTISNSEFLKGINLIDTEYEETKTGLERKM